MTEIRFRFLERKNMHTSSEPKWAGEHANEQWIQEGIKIKTIPKAFYSNIYYLLKISSRNVFFFLCCYCFFQSPISSP